MSISILNGPKTCVRVPNHRRAATFVYAFFWFSLGYNTMSISILNEPKTCVWAPNRNRAATFFTFFYYFVGEVTPRVSQF